MSTAIRTTVHCLPHQAQYGLLVSYGFALLYSAFSFPAGYACDRFPRTRLLFGAALAWAAATAAQGMARCFAHVLLARVLLGIAQSFSGPAAHTLISDSFPASRRATANAIYSSGIYLGAALASLSAVLGQSVGWRATSFTVAAASAVPALCLALFIKEPPRPVAAAAAATAGSGGGGGGAARGSRPAQVLRVASVRLVLAAAAARLFSGFAIGAWVAPFYRTYFPAHVRQFAVLNAAIVAGGGTLATVMGGVLSDRLTSGGKGHLAAYVPAVGSLLAIPCWVCAMQARRAVRGASATPPLPRPTTPHHTLPQSITTHSLPTPTTHHHPPIKQARSFLPSMGWLLVAYLLAETWFGATISFLQGGLPPSVWGTAQGLLNVVQVAGNASPLLIGAALQRGASLRTMLTLCVPAGYLVCAVLFFLAARARTAELAAGKDA